MTSSPGHKDTPHRLEENEQWLREQIEGLRAMNEESRVALQHVVERQALFIQATQDIADRQRALAGHIAGAVSDGAEPYAVRSLGGVAPVASMRSLASSSSSPHILTMPKRSGSFVRTIVLSEDTSSLPIPRDVGCFQWTRLVSQKILRTPCFDYIIALCVFANAVTIGVEIDMELLGQDTRVVAALEYFFVCVYVVEMCMRFLADGPKCLRNRWVLFDFVLVVIGTVSIFFGDLFISFLKKNGASGEVTEGIDQVLVLRMVRLFRLARALRIFSIFKSLWKLVVGFFHSLKTMASTVVLMTITIYIFACLGVELITKDDTLGEDEVAAYIVSEHFASIPRIMLTLIQFATMDSVASVYYPLIMLRPWLIAYFITVLLTLSIAVMNLVTALIVEDALASTAQDADANSLAMRKRIKRMSPLIKDIFRSLDRSGDGCIQIDEIVEGFQSKEVIVPQELREVVSLDRLLDLFEFLDLDGSGALDEGEFVEGMCHLAITSVPVETTQILALLRQQRRDIGLLHNDVQDMRGLPASSRLGRSASRKMARERSSIQELDI